MNLAACKGLATIPIVSTWFRAVRPKYWPSSLLTAHTRTIPGRFNSGTATHPAFEALYLATDPVLALFEVGGLLGSPLPSGVWMPYPHASWTIVNVGVSLSSVVDLTSPTALRALQTTVQELTGDWRGYTFRPSTPSLRGPHWSNVPTQRLGRALFLVPRLEGFITYSSHDSTKANLVVFPAKLNPGSFAQYLDPATGASFRIP